MTRRFVRATALLLGAVLTQCVDTSPLTYVPDKDAGMHVDGGSADSGLILSCRHCLEDEGAPCRPKYDPCAKIPKCVATLDCVIDTGCFEFASIQDRIACGLPCLTKEGVVAGTDPTTTALGQINVCVVTSCSDACVRK